MNERATESQKFSQYKNTSDFTQKCHKNYDEGSDVSYITEIEDEYFELLGMPHNVFSLYLGKMKIKKCGKIVYNLNDKNFLC